MADKNSGWWCTASTSIVAETNTTKTIRVTCYWTTGSWNYNINNVSAWVYCNGEHRQVYNAGSVNTSGYNQSVSLGYSDFVITKGTSGQNAVVGGKITSNSTYVSGTKWSGDINVWVDAKPSYTVTYNANGGSGAPGNQTKWYGTDLTLSSTKPTKTGHSFSKWNTNSGGTGTSYNPGATYSGNSNLTLYAIWTANTYTVTYNANGGTGAPGNQTKTYGVNLTLSSTKPTRTNYNFKGWSTSANGSVVYAAGATYTNNSAVTLYAVWELAYKKPRLNNFAAQRCTSGGTVTEDGVYAKVTFSWATDKNVTAIKIQYRLQTTSTWTDVAVTASGKSGSVSQIVNGSFNTESSYFIRAYVSDGSGNDYTTYSTTATLGTIKYPIDVKDGGKGVAFGKTAELENYLDVNFFSKFRKNVAFDGNVTVGGKDVILKSTFAANSDFNSLTTPGIYTCSTTPTGSNYPIASAGILEVFNLDGMITQRYTTYHGIFIFMRSYYSNEWKPWHNIGSTIMATCYPSSRIVVNGNSWVDLKVTCDAALSNTSLGLLTLSDGGIKIGKNINTIKISAALSFFYFDGTGEFSVKIKNNSTIVANQYSTASEANKIYDATLNPLAINVKEGDVISLYIVKPNVNDLTILNNNGSTSLTVEVLN